MECTGVALRRHAHTAGKHARRDGRTEAKRDFAATLALAPVQNRDSHQPVQLRFAALRPLPLRLSSPPSLLSLSPSVCCSASSSLSLLLLPPPPPLRLNPSTVLERDRECGHCAQLRSRLFNPIHHEQLLFCRRPSPCRCPCIALPAS